MSDQLKSIQTIGIIGLGLIGTSFGMALKRKHPHIKILGVTRSKKSGTAALQKKAVDEIVPAVSDLTCRTGLIVLATPIRATMALLPLIGKLAQKLILVTDTGSTKMQICAIAGNLPSHVSFIGGHPMAGKETAGAKNADPNLFMKRPWIFTHEGDEKNVELTLMETVVMAIGAVPIRMTAADHDRIVAIISHLPFVLSALLMETAAEHISRHALERLAGSGFRDVTRLAGGNPIMHADILRTNKKNILSSLGQFEQALSALKTDIALEHWPAIEEKLKTMQQARISWERSQL
ncbi:prephenate dehydrogenase/arogenate dehydrogenase family protein [Candidatus Gottesmanbacteria bacterium]|nr:prephenate dehydrogenase/arogenate dehydrogenase family protein [Candidatus Gottesmanbacteria bacterium]